jgi:hypothetical protein
MRFASALGVLGQPVEINAPVTRAANLPPESRPLLPGKTASRKIFGHDARRIASRHSADTWKLSD